MAYACAHVCAQKALAEGAQLAHIRAMNYAASIISKFGGVRAAAAVLGRAPSTIQGWKVRGSIPDGEKPSVLAAANLRGIDITKDDFWPAQTSEDAA
jgi:hypothetical protein